MLTRREVLMAAACVPSLPRVGAGEGLFRALDLLFRGRGSLPSDTSNNYVWLDGRLFVASYPTSDGPSPARAPWGLAGVVERKGLPAGRRTCAGALEPGTPLYETVDSHRAHMAGMGVCELAVPGQDAVWQWVGDHMQSVMLQALADGRAIRSSSHTVISAQE